MTKPHIVKESIAFEIDEYSHVWTVYYIDTPEHRLSVSSYGFNRACDTAKHYDPRKG